MHLSICSYVCRMHGVSKQLYGHGNGTNFSLNEDDVHVKTDYNTVDTNNGMAVGGTGADFVELGAGADNIAMGNAGNDTYVVDANDDGVINELGKLMSSTNLSGSDSVQFELVEDIADLDFSRGEIAGEADGSTLFIDGSAGGDGKATLFDQYNDFLSFRKTEYLVIDDGATADEVFELVTGDATDPSGNSWENEVYVAKSGTDSIDVDAGGLDHVYLASGADTVDVIGALGSDDTVFIHGVDASGSDADTIKIGGGSAQSVGFGHTLVVIDDGGANSYADWAAYEAYLNSQSA